MGTLCENVFTFTAISRWILHGMRSVSNESCRQNQNTHFAFNNTFFPYLENQNKWRVEQIDSKQNNNKLH
jgi:hypothetical protein